MRSPSGFSTGCLIECHQQRRRPQRHAPDATSISRAETIAAPRVVELTFTTLSLSECRVRVRQRRSNMPTATAAFSNSGLGIVLATDANMAGGLMRPVSCLPQSDFRPAETHRNPSGDQLQHKLAGVTTIVRQVIGKLDADAPLFCHDPHFKWRRVCRKAVPEHRQPVSLGEVEEHS